MFTAWYIVTRGSEVLIYDKKEDLVSDLKDFDIEEIVAVFNGTRFDVGHALSEHD